MLEGVSFPEFVSTLRDLIVPLILSDGGEDDLSLLRSDGLESGRSSRDGGTVRCEAQMGAPPLGVLLSGKLEKFGLSVKSSEVGIGVGGKEGTGGGTSLGKPFRVVEGERERRLKNDLFFLPAASER